MNLPANRVLKFAPWIGRWEAAWLLLPLHERMASIVAVRGAAITELGRSDFTCDGCGMRTRCAYAYDMYNTDGDCLASK